MIELMAIAWLYVFGTIATLAVQQPETWHDYLVSVFWPVTIPLGLSIAALESIKDRLT